MKTILSYTVLIALGWGLGTLGRYAYLEWSKPDIPVNVGPGGATLTDKEETLYRRARSRALSLLDSATSTAEQAAALAEIEKMIDLAPGRAEGHTKYAWTGLEIIERKSQYSPVSQDMANLKAIEIHVKAAAHLAPEDWDVLRLSARWLAYTGKVAIEMGETDLGRKKIEEALATLEDAGKIHSQDTKRFGQLLVNKAEMLHTLKRHDEALKKLDLALENETLRQEASLIHLNRARILDDLDKEEDAVKAFEASLRSPRPPVIEIYGRRASFYERRGYKDLALKDLQFLKNLMPRNTALQKRIDEIKKSLSERRP